jgi:transcription antitermination factor NusG
MGTFESTTVARADSASLIAVREPELPASYVEPSWYAAYTCANHEKRLAQQLEQRSIEHLLPLYESVRRWKDRRMRLRMPLFPGYVFVRFSLRDRLQVLQVPSLVRLVGFGGQPKVLPQSEIETLRDRLSGRVNVEPHPYLTIGLRVRIKSGPLEGCEGILIRRKGTYRVVLSIEMIMRSVVVDVDLVEIEPLER